MGVHHANGALVGALRPQVLVYKPKSNDRLHLMPSSTSSSQAK